MSSTAARWRWELFFKSQQELQQKVIPFLQANQVARVNLTNKAKEDRLLESAKLLRAALPHLDMCLHYSIKWNYQTGLEASQAALERFCQEAAHWPNTSLLLISGGGKKRKLDTVQALVQGSSQQDGRGLRALPVHVAFNPYFPEAKDRQAERTRLKAKLESGLVAGIYLQVGSDLNRLREGLMYLQHSVEHCLQSGACQRRPVLHGSVFMPSKRLLSQMKFRPWNGVFLSDDYLSSVEAAEAITEQLVQVYEDFNVIPLLETAVRTSGELRQAYKTMKL